MLYTLLWVCFFLLVALFVAALVAKLFVRVRQGPQEEREAHRRQHMAGDER